MSATFIHEATLAQLNAALESGELTAERLVLAYLERIALVDPQLNAVLEVNPDALFIARALDQERSLHGPRGPLHGIPVLLKDNIDTGDKLHTSAGSLALATSRAPQDAFVAARLRQAGAVILGKVNMTEWANFMTQGMPSGYSSRGGQVVNPYDPAFDPGGSSAGSAVAVAANLCAVAVGTETSGSILDPASNNAIVGIKPTVGLISRTGIIPIAFSQDTAGPMARTVTDAAILLGTMTGIDPADPATGASEGRSYTDYTPFLDRDGLKGARLGIVRKAYFEDELTEEQQRLFAEAIEVLRREGATVEWVEIESCRDGYWRSNVLLYEFKAALEAYFASLGPSAPVRTLAELIAFNEGRPAAALKYGQTLLVAAERTRGTLTEPAYLLDRLKDQRLAGPEGIDAVMAAHRLDAILFPGSFGAWLPARAGYPSITVPGGYTSANHPLGITFTGTAWSEPTLIRLGYAFEQATKLRRPASA
ncbi:MAG TPA: amidase [Symbiobacteriaceae bacterium]|nr:amidase [Symbiobacteriaceae bacterium]